jgi:hypothetical protein
MTKYIWSRHTECYFLASMLSFEMNVFIIVELCDIGELKLLCIETQVDPPIRNETASMILSHTQCIE